MYPGEQGDHSVYRLDFPCGNASVGMTVRMVHDRVEEHIGGGAFGSRNTRVGWEVQAHGEPAVSVIVSGLSRDEARRWELVAISRTPRGLRSRYGVAQIDCTEACEDALNACGIAVDVVASWAERRLRPGPTLNCPECPDDFGASSAGVFDLEGSPRDSETVDAISNGRRRIRADSERTCRAGQEQVA